MEEKFSFFLFIITVFDIYFNYNIYEFPQYHKARIYSGIFTLSSIFIPFILLIFICFTGCLLYFQLINNDHMRSCTVFITIISSIFVISLSFGSIFYQFYSIYLYFFCGGRSKIKSLMIKLFMAISLMSISIKIFFAICNLISSLKNRKNDSSENNEDTELLEQSEVWK